MSTCFGTISREYEYIGVCMDNYYCIRILQLKPAASSTDLEALMHMRVVEMERWIPGVQQFSLLRTNTPADEPMRYVMTLTFANFEAYTYWRQVESELLQSIIVGLAITHHPHLVNFVLVDFKGGAAFKPFEKIPHTVGMVTDLSGKLTERALVALKSELRRREHILSEANAKKISEYIQMRAQNPAMEPLPHLFIVIDEFAELAKEHPIFMEGLVSVVQKGRSLGVHHILATQKPTGSVNANIWSNLKFRICLRVASLQDSRDMLGRSEAGLLPSTIPGRAYFQIGAEIFKLFQSARTSLPARISDIPLPLLAEKNEEMTDMQVLMGLLEPYQATLGAEL